MFVRESSRFVALAMLTATLACATDANSPSVSAPDVSFAQAATTGVTVGTVIPSESLRDITLDIQINGTGFDRTSQASLPLHGVVDPRVRVNSTRYVKSTQVVANVTISADAVIDKYDVVIALASGKKGIGTEAFIVELQAEALTGGYHVNAVNVNGEAVGDATNPAYPGSCPTPARQAYWDAAGNRTLLPIGSYCGGSALAINASGTILGNLNNAAGGPTARGLWFPNGNGGYTVQALGPAPDGYFPLGAGGLNDNNEVLGWNQLTARLYVWSAATGWTYLQVPSGATQCFATNAINNRGEFAARCTVAGVASGYYWASRDAAPVLLPRPAAAGDVTPRAMNDNGVIVGTGPNSGLRWSPTPSGYVLDVFPASSGLSAIAADGTMAGSITRNNGSNGPSPVIFYSPTSYQVLGLTSNGRWGTTSSIALGPTGMVVGGTEGNVKALRWRVASPQF